MTSAYIGWFVTNQILLPPAVKKLNVALLSSYLVRNDVIHAGCQAVKCRSQKQLPVFMCQATCDKCDLRWPWMTRRHEWCAELEGLEI
jgi:hypothetical protein